MLAGTAQRVGDILNISVDRAIQSEIIFVQEKTHIPVHIPNPCLSDIVKYIQEMKLNSTDYIFATGIKRSPIDYSTVYRMILEVSHIVLQRDDISPHTFRKYGAVKLSKDGLTPNQIRAVTGHASTSMIDYYVGQEKPVKDLKNRLIGE